MNTGKLLEVARVHTDLKPEPGIYKATWCGYQITIQTDRRSVEWRIRTEQGVRGIVPVTVTVGEDRSISISR